MATKTATHDLATLHQKIDWISAQLEAQQRQQQELQELQQDMLPIVNHMIKLSIDELAEIGNDFQLEDLLFLLKRVLRNTRLIRRLMDMVEGTAGLIDELQPIGMQAFSTSVETLDRLEREGYFAFAQEGWHIVERIVNEFSEDDVRALGDNIVTILTTVRNMTQPEILSLANNAITAINPREQVKDISTLRLIRELGDPRVRRGMARLLNMVKALDDQSSMDGNGKTSSELNSQRPGS
jgi:uncharacterized protein YjgD (DUF1641 family)